MKSLTFFVLISIAIFIGLLYTVPEYSLFAMVLIKISITLYLISIIDKTILKNIDLIQELKDKNVAVAIVISTIIYTVCNSFN
jgi:hypothetical protein